MTLCSDVAFSLYSSSRPQKAETVIPGYLSQLVWSPARPESSHQEHNYPLMHWNGWFVGPAWPAELKNPTVYLWYHDCTAQESHSAVFSLDPSSVTKQIKLVADRSPIRRRLHPSAFLIAASHDIFVGRDWSRRGWRDMGWITSSAIGYIALGDSADFSKDLEIYGWSAK